METVDIDVDNLFNDGQLDQILPTEHALQPSSLAVPGLTEHYLSLRFCGGFNRVSWSRQGHIAVISEDGSTVNIHCLRSAAQNKEWQLSKPRALDTTFENAVLVNWGPSGIDLAVVDSKGRVGIYSMTTICLNRLSESKSPFGDGFDEPGMPVGTWWLNQDRQDRARPIISSLTRGPQKWTQNTTKAEALRPLFPRAFCMLSRQGTVSLTYHRLGSRYQRSSVALPLPSGTSCSHAAFAPTTEGKILLAVRLTNGDLSVYHIQITWPQETASDSVGPGQPDLVVEIIDICVSMWSDNDGDNEENNNDNDNTSTPAYKPDDWALTHLVIIPTSDIETSIRQPPCIWAVYTSVNTAVNANSDGFLLNSVIRRWAVDAFVRGLHARFDDIPTKTETSASTENVFAVERLSDIVFSRVITSIELIDGGQIVSISTADGRTELWNPVTQALVSYEGQVDEVTSLAQFGFAFNPAINALSTTLSPNACASINMTEELNPYLQQVHLPLRTSMQDLDLSDPHQSASIAAVVLAFNRSCWSSTNSDDILACAKANYLPSQYSIIVSELYRTLFRDVEFIHEKTPGNEIGRLASKPIVAKVLSFQMALLGSNSISSTSADADIRFAALSSVWAWVTINIRYIATALYLFYREYQASQQQVQQNPNQAPPSPLSTSFVDAICNTIHWTLDFFRFVLNTILEIGDRQTNPSFFTKPTFTNNLGDAEGNGAQGLVALILNSQWSRSFLITIARTMRVFMNANAQSNQPQMARVYQTIYRYSVSKGMSISAIDKLLDSRWYARCGLREGEAMDPATIAQRQISICSTGRLGPEFAGTLRSLLDNVINAPDTGLRATGEIERLKLWSDSPDLNWLLLGLNSPFVTEMHSMSAMVTNSAPALSPKDIPGWALDNAGASSATDWSSAALPSSLNRTLYDIHRKSSLVIRGTPDQLIRRCIRCGSVSGDVEGIDRSWSQPMVVYLTRCVCEAYWILEPIVPEEI